MLQVGIQCVLYSVWACSCREIWRFGGLLFLVTCKAVLFEQALVGLNRPLRPHTVTLIPGPVLTPYSMFTFLTRSASAQQKLGGGWPDEGHEARTLLALNSEGRRCSHSRRSYGHQHFS
ncbi:hypothetical protein DFH94DRAFT_713333 [Russula ochroleuca]|uniref:Uncharacterized protein n=1 Tax=Russula ochroleuca TaxID=152965 RepID=A0A9P5JUL3_9AGAM|nr:hypothetical protein DFH94DRAFT_789264 [Russula ochroleuca]KAF8486443.1 hypothetical protein DFH94DRAFT_713333 [Russula ochroleuca]